MANFKIDFLPTFARCTFASSIHNCILRLFAIKTLTNFRFLLVTHARYPQKRFRHLSCSIIQAALHPKRKKDMYIALWKSLPRSPTHHHTFVAVSDVAKQQQIWSLRSDPKMHVAQHPI